MKLFLVTLVVVSALVLFFAVTSQAAVIDLDIIKSEKSPEAQAGYIVSFKNEGVEATLTSPILAKSFDWGKLSLNIGGAPAINEVIGSLTYQIPKDAIEKWDIEIPFAKLFDIQAGLYGGFEVNEYNNHPEKKWYKALDYGMAGIVATARF